MTTQERLREILNNIEIGDYPAPGWSDKTFEAILDLIETEIIGADKPENSFDEDYVNGWNNCLEQQRTTLRGKNND